MTYNTGEKHLVEIDHVSVIEAIDEKFDGITSIMPLNSVMYGSTVTALIAKLPIVGDLDIAVSSQEFGKLTRNIAASVKWIQTAGPTILESGLRFNSTRRIALSSPEDKYGKAKQMPISKVVSFQAVNNATVQIMEAKEMTGDMLEDALSVVRKVDFTFCGMALDRYGRMLETIPYAYDDCVQRVIRIKDYQHQTDPKQLKARIHKYVERGWNLTFSIDQAMMNLDTAKKAYLKRLAARPTRKSTKGRSITGMRIRTYNTKGVTIEISKGLNDIMRKRGSIADVISSFTAKHYNIGMKWFHTPTGITQCWQRSPSADGSKMNFAKAKIIIRDVSRYINERYGINAVKIRTAERNSQSKAMYNLGKSSHTYSDKYSKY